MYIIITMPWLHIHWQLLLEFDLTTGEYLLWFLTVPVIAAGGECPGIWAATEGKGVTKPLLQRDWHLEHG